MDLIEIGAALREGRERKGMTVEAVEEKTKIAPSVIVALEEGNSARFPHPVYARGFVRSYALLLGLDAQELCAHFSREYPVPKDTDHPEIPSPQIHVKMHDSGRVVTVVRIVAIVGILALGALGWYVFNHYRSPVPQAPLPVEETAPPAAPAEPLPSESLPAPLTQMQEVAAAPDDQPGADMSVNASEGETLNATGEAPAVVPGGTAGGDEQAGQLEQAVEPKPAAEAKPAGQAVEPVVSAVSGQERSLRIIADSASWLQARPDDKVLDYFLRKGESTTVSFSKSLSIKFGNAGGIKLELDGQPYPFEGALGEVKTLVLE
jgi:cytoskeleton protein RodZ